MGAGEDILKVLARIEGKLDRLLASGGGDDIVAPATEADLDSQHGDPKIKYDPKRWAGESYKGKNFSEAPADYLDLLAEAFEYFAKKNAKAGEEKKADYDRRDAARAKGWAARIRAGWVRVVHEPGAEVGW